MICKVQRLYDVRDTKKIEIVCEEKKELAQILMHYRQSRYRCAVSWCSESLLSNSLHAKITLPHQATKLSAMVYCRSPMTTSVEEDACSLV
jgi:hypothetical protein